MLEVCWTLLDRVKHPITVVCYAEQDCHQNQSPIRIYSRGNKGHSHSHAGCFPFLPISIPKFVIISHSHGIPISVGIPFPCHL